MEVTVVIPCLNEAPTVGQVVRSAREAFEAVGVTFEVLVADNGSTDDSRSVAEAAGARVVDASAQRGYGAATIVGGRAAQGQFLVFADADGEHDLRAAPQLFQEAKAQQALVIGSRSKGGFAPGAGHPLNRFVGTPVLTFLLNHFIDTRVTDCNGGFRAMPRSVFDRLNLRSSGMELATEMIVRARLWGIPIVELPTTQLPPPEGRQPHLRRFRDGWRHLKFILLHAPDRVLLTPGLSLVLLGLVLFLPQLTGPAQLGPIRIDIHVMILAALLLLIGVEMTGCAIVCASIAGEPIAPRGRLSARLGAYFALDRILPWAALLFLLGLAADVAVIVISARVGFEVWEPRLALTGTVAMAMATQVAVMSFVHSVVESQRIRHVEPEP